MLFHDDQETNPRLILSMTYWTELGRRMSKHDENPLAPIEALLDNVPK